MPEVRRGRVSRLAPPMAPLFVFAVWLATAPFAAVDGFNCGSPLSQPSARGLRSDRDSERLAHACPTQAGVRVEQGVVMGVLAGSVLVVAGVLDAGERRSAASTADRPGWPRSARRNGVDAG